MIWRFGDCPNRTASPGAPGRPDVDNQSRDRKGAVIRKRSYRKLAMDPRRAGTSVGVPAGRHENSPAMYRWVKKAKETTSLVGTKDRSPGRKSGVTARNPNTKPRQGRYKRSAKILPPLRGLCWFCARGFPGLAPWAMFYRPTGLSVRAATNNHERTSSLSQYHFRRSGGLGRAAARTAPHRRVHFLRRNQPPQRSL